MAALHARRATLHGCLLTRTTDGLRITREYDAARRTEGRPGACWDGRWLVTPCPDTSGPPVIDPRDLRVRALGHDGILACRPKDQWLLPHASLLASPSVWYGTRLIAAPLAGFGSGWHVKLKIPAHEFMPGALRGLIADAGSLCNKG